MRFVVRLLITVAAVATISLAGFAEEVPNQATPGGSDFPQAASLPPSHPEHVLLSLCEFTTAMPACWFAPAEEAAATCQCASCACEDCECSDGTCECENCSSECQCENCSCEDCQCSGGECQCEGCSATCQCADCSCTDCQCSGGACECEDCSCEDSQCSGGDCQCMANIFTRHPNGLVTGIIVGRGECQCERCSCEDCQCSRGDCQCEAVTVGEEHCDFDSSCWCGPPQPPAMADVSDGAAPVVAPFSPEVCEIARTREQLRRAGIDPFAGSCFDQYDGGAMQFAQRTAQYAEQVAGAPVVAPSYPPCPVSGTWHPAPPTQCGDQCGPRLQAGPAVPTPRDLEVEARRRAYSQLFSAQPQCEVCPAPGPRMAMVPVPHAPQYVDSPPGSSPYAQPVAPTSYETPDTSAHLRDIGRQLEEQAAMLEDAADYGRADELRQLAEEVRHQARMLRAEQDAR